MFTTIHGQKLWYTDTKRGKPVLFLHGWRQTCDCWDVPSIIKQKYRIITLDLPGHGQSPITKPYTLDDLVGLVIEFCASLKLEKPVVIGHSLAGTIVARLLSYHPDFAAAIFLVAPAGLRIPSIASGRKLSVLSALPISSSAKASLLKRFYKRSKKNQLHPDNKVDALLRETFVGLILENVVKDYKKIRVPTSIVWGEKDTIIPLKIGRALARKIKHATLYVMEQSGHFPFTEHRKEFYQLLGQVLAQV